MVKTTKPSLLYRFSRMGKKKCSCVTPTLNSLFLPCSVPSARAFLSLELLAFLTSQPSFWLLLLLLLALTRATKYSLKLIKVRRQEIAKGLNPPTLPLHLTSQVSPLPHSLLTYH
jgi:hypothetical protein